ncbi:hypothetical protein [Streptomyces sp. NBC_00989]|uniref:hypothetical protein n=1 Tax=Streptomyces sp. NBC_00989 TaxID=2903705 RepID=UPI0038655307|nr:hypothetical protein OG714_38300 [Streptomyces sp. NBC_00989]
MTRPAPAATIAGSRRPEHNHCWLCGTPGTPRTLRADVHMNGHLCPRCWQFQPRGRNTWSRAASALCIALALPRGWHDSGLRTTWLQDAAQQHGITAWHDTQGVLAPAAPFDWIPAHVLTAAAADLTALEEEFQRSRIPPDRKT